MNKQGQDLAKRGGGIQILTCQGEDGQAHVCFRTSEDDEQLFDINGATYRIPWGY